MKFRLDIYALQPIFTYYCVNRVRSTQYIPHIFQTDSKIVGIKHIDYSHPNPKAMSQPVDVKFLEQKDGASKIQVISKRGYGINSTFEFYTL